MSTVNRMLAMATRVPPAVTMLAISLMYALCFVAVKIGLAFAPPLLFAGLRTLLGGLFLLGIVRVRDGSLMPVRALWPWIGVLAMVATTFTYGAMFLSPGRTGAGIASVLGNLQPLIVILLAAAFLSERLTRYTTAALILGLAGATLIASPALFAPDAYGLPGAALALGASAGAAAGSVIIKRMRRPVAVVTVSAWQLLVGSLPLFVLSAVVERDASTVWNSEFVSLLLILALLGTSLPTAVWYSLIQHHDVTRLSIYLFLVPVFGAAVAFLAFSEPLSVSTTAGVVLTVASVVAIAAERPRPARQPEIVPSAATFTGVASRIPDTAGATTDDQPAWWARPR